MKGSKPFPFLVLSLCLCAVLAGCAGGTPANPPGALNIANQKVPDGVVQSPYSVTFVPTGGLAPFTWTLDSGSLPPGLNLSSGGVISGTPPTTDLNSDGTAKKYNFTVRVTDSQTPTAAYQKGAFSITINPLPIVTSTTLPDAILGVAYSTTLTNSGGLAPFKWSVSAGSLPPGLVLDPNAGTISGTATGQGMTYPFTIQVTDADSNTASANVSITVKGKLQGTFAFSFNGFNNGNPFYMVGSFVGDGTGSLSGVLDQNDPVNGAVANTPFTGTYTVSANGLGTMTFTIPALNNVTYNYVLAVPLNGNLRFILSDADHPQVYGSGSIKTQDISKFTGITLQAALVQLAGNYSMGFFGVDSGGSRNAGAGSFKADNSGTISNGLEDTNDNGVVHQRVSFTGSWTLDSNFATTGRGTQVLTVNGSAQHYAFYVVNPSIELVAMQTDAASSGLSLVSGLKQLPGSANGSFSDGTLNSAAVMMLNGVSSSTGSPDVSLGVGNFDGKGNITLFQLDENNGGTVTTAQPTTGNYNVEVSTGRVVTSGISSTPPIWYLVNSNRGFVIGTDSSATEGQFEPQTGGPFSLGSFLLGYAGATITPTLTSVTNEADSTIIPAPGGTLVVTYDTSGPGGPQMSLMLKSAYTLDANGGTTGKFILTAVGSPVPTAVVYMITAAAAVTGGSPDYTNNKWASLNIATPSGAADPNPRITYVGSTH